MTRFRGAGERKQSTHSQWGRGEKAKHAQSRERKLSTQSGWVGVGVGAGMRKLSTHSQGGWGEKVKHTQLG